MSTSPFLINGVIDGKAVGEAIKKEVSEKVQEMKAKHGKVPGLAVIIVGERKDSQTYVRMKKRACDEVGIASFGKDLPADATQADVVAAVRAFNRHPDVHGILVQLPLPAHIDESAVLSEISLEKDVDGFHPLNIGRLCMKGRDPLFVPCTPLGCIELLDRCGIEIKGKKAVVVGRSNIVGMPAAMLLNKRDATVTIAHSRTKDIAAVVRTADIIIAAAGQPEMIKKDWVKPGAVIIDVGTNPVDDATKKTGYRLVGDADFAGCKEVTAAITPVPGGVGPMTIAMLLKNTCEGCARDVAGLNSSLKATTNGSEGAWDLKAVVSMAVPALVGLAVGLLLKTGKKGSGAVASGGPGKKNAFLV